MCIGVDEEFMTAFPRERREAPQLLRSFKGARWARVMKSKFTVLIYE